MLPFESKRPEGTCCSSMLSLFLSGKSWVPLWPAFCLPFAQRHERQWENSFSFAIQGAGVVATNVPWKGQKKQHNTTTSLTCISIAMEAEWYEIPLEWRWSRPTWAISECCWKREFSHFIHLTRILFLEMDDEKKISLRQHNSKEKGAKLIPVFPSAADQKLSGEPGKH